MSLLFHYTDCFLSIVNNLQPQVRSNFITNSWVNILTFLCQLKATKNEMKPKNSFCVLKDIQQLFITHLDQATVKWSALIQTSSLTEGIAPAGQRFQTSLRIETFEPLFYLSDQQERLNKKGQVFQTCTGDSCFRKHLPHLVIYSSRTGYIYHEEMWSYLLKTDIKVVTRKME